MQQQQPLGSIVMGEQAAAELRQALQDRRDVRRALEEFRSRKSFKCRTARACCEFLETMGSSRNATVLMLRRLLIEQLNTLLAHAEKSPVSTAQLHSLFPVAMQAVDALLVSDLRQISSDVIRVICVPFLPNVEIMEGGSESEVASALAAASCLYPLALDAPETPAVVRAVLNRLLEVTAKDPSTQEFCRHSSSMAFRGLIFAATPDWLVERLTSLVLRVATALRSGVALSDEQQQHASSFFGLTMMRDDGASAMDPAFRATLTELCEIASHSLFAWKMFCRVVECLVRFSNVSYIDEVSKFYQIIVAERQAFLKAESFIDSNVDQCIASVFTLVLQRVCSSDLVARAAEPAVTVLRTLLPVVLAHFESGSSGSSSSKAGSKSGGSAASSNPGTPGPNTAGLLKNGPPAAAASAAAAASPLLISPLTPKSGAGAWLSSLRSVEIESLNALCLVGLLLLYPPFLFYLGGQYFQRRLFCTATESIAASVDTQKDADHVLTLMAFCLGFPIVARNVDRIQGRKQRLPTAAEGPPRAKRRRQDDEFAEQQQQLALAAQQQQLQRSLDEDETDWRPNPPPGLSLGRVLNLIKVNASVPPAAHSELSRNLRETVPKLRQVIIRFLRVLSRILSHYVPTPCKPEEAFQTKELTGRIIQFLQLCSGGGQHNAPPPQQQQQTTATTAATAATTTTTESSVGPTSSKAEAVVNTFSSEHSSRLLRVLIACLLACTVNAEYLSSVAKIALEGSTLLDSSYDGEPVTVQYLGWLLRCVKSPRFIPPIFERFVLTPSNQQRLRDLMVLRHKPWEPEKPDQLRRLLLGSYQSLGEMVRLSGTSVLAELLGRRLMCLSFAVQTVNALPHEKQILLEDPDVLKHLQLAREEAETRASTADYYVWRRIAKNLVIR